MNKENKKQKLDDLVVTIELTLMSVIQGVALFFLADNTRIAVMSYDIEHWIYIPIAFMVLVVFWAQALVHIISFISWPIELIHNFLYFLVVIAEVFMFSNINNPPYWFAANVAFFIVVGILYLVDYTLMRKKRAEFQNSDERKKFFEEIMADQKLGMKLFVPVGIIFSLFAWFLILSFPTIFIAGHWHLVLATVQAIAGFSTLSYLVSVFKKHFISLEEI